MAFRIVNDMPIPPHAPRGNAGSDKYKLRSLTVGQVVIFDADDEGWRENKNGERYHLAVMNSAAVHRRHPKLKFTCRKLPDGSIGIWRIA